MTTEPKRYGSISSSVFEPTPGETNGLIDRHNSNNKNHNNNHDDGFCGNSSVSFFGIAAVVVAVATVSTLLVAASGGGTGMTKFGMDPLTPLAANIVPPAPHTTATAKKAPPLPFSSSSSSSSLSTRGRSGCKQIRPDADMYHEASSDPYDPVSNPNGYINYLFAENTLMQEEMKQKLRDVAVSSFSSSSSSSSPLPSWMFQYGDFTGNREFRSAISKIMERWIENSGRVDPDSLVTSSGAGSILSLTAWCLAEEGDAVIVSGPAYSAFSSDYSFYGGLKMFVAKTKPENRYEPTVPELETAHAKALSAGHAPKIYVICQPTNPTGLIYTAESMKLQIEWALSKGLHVVSDEIYALSTFPSENVTSAADVMYEISVSRWQEEEEEEFVTSEGGGVDGGGDGGGSFKYLGDRVHVVAGLSKDWGMSGFRVGTLFSHNEELLKAAGTLEYYSSVSQYTQHSLTELFADESWSSWYVEENQKRLHGVFTELKESFATELGVNTTPAQGGMFAWIDFSSYLLEEVEEEIEDDENGVVVRKRKQTEIELWNEIFDETGVAVSPGESFFGEKPGYFRLCYASLSSGVEAVREATKRLSKWKTAREKGIESIS